MPGRRQERRRSFGHARARYGVRPRTWTGRGLQCGGVQAVRGNRGKSYAIDAHGMFHFANSNAVFFVISQSSLMAMLLPAFARNVAVPSVASNTFVHIPQSRNHFLMEQILLLEMEWNSIHVRKSFSLYRILQEQHQFSARNSQNRTESLKVEA